MAQARASEPVVIDRFAGINNVNPPGARLNPGELTAATNVFVDRTGAVRPRTGTARRVAGSFTSVWTNGTVIYAVMAGDLVEVNSADWTTTVLKAGVGTSAAVWLELPADGSVVFMNAAESLRIVDGTAIALGVPLPASLGTAADGASGSLRTGVYRYGLSYVRTSDGLEGGAVFSSGTVSIASGSLDLTALPALAGHTINVYLTSADDDQFYYAGNTATATFTFGGANDQLIVPCRTAFLSPPPNGSVLGMFRGRLLVGVDNVLFASLPWRPELFDLRQDYKQFPSGVRFVCEVDDGLYVGLADEVLFLSGVRFNELTQLRVYAEGAVLGSAVRTNGGWIGLGDRMGSGPAVLCIAGNTLCAGFNSGQWVALTEGRYRFDDAQRVTATVRFEKGVHQYVVADA
jgi:hypothetical protein